MIFSSALWALGQFILHWGITTATISMPFVVEDHKAAAYTFCRAQDAPHALGGALADQFSW